MQTIHTIFCLCNIYSWFYDAPLSYYGLTQVEEMAAFLKDKPITDDGSPESDHLKILRADPGAPKSKIICSNLRRAVSTLSFGFSDRLSRRKSDKILVVPFLQEISRNPDTLSITPPHTPIQASWIEKTYKQFQFQTIFNTQTDMSLHTGNKPMDSNGLKRMNDFCEYIFNTSTTNNNQTTPADANNANNYLGGIKEEYIIVGGHSIWFRYFFQTFLPYSVHHVSKNKKIVNCGIITFDLLKAETKRGPKYMIDPKTIKTIYGGF